MFGQEQKVVSSALNSEYRSKIIVQELDLGFGCPVLLCTGMGLYGSLGDIRSQNFWGLVDSNEGRFVL